jgi:hypothetical protein
VLPANMTLSSAMRKPTVAAFLLLSHGAVAVQCPSLWSTLNTFTDIWNSFGISLRELQQAARRGGVATSGTHISRSLRVPTCAAISSGAILSDHANVDAALASAQGHKLVYYSNGGDTNYILGTGAVGTTSDGTTLPSATPITAPSSLVRVPCAPSASCFVWTVPVLSPPF